MTTTSLIFLKALFSNTLTDEIINNFISSVKIDLKNEENQIRFLNELIAILLSAVDYGIITQDSNAIIQSSFKQAYSKFPFEEKFKEYDNFIFALIQIRQNYPQSKALSSLSQIKLLNDLVDIADNFDQNIKTTIYLCSFNLLRNEGLLTENIKLTNKIINFLSKNLQLLTKTSEEYLFYNFIIKLIYQEPLQNFNLSEVLS